MEMLPVKYQNIMQLIPHILIKIFFPWSLREHGEEKIIDKITIENILRGLKLENQRWLVFLPMN